MSAYQIALEELNKKLSTVTDAKEQSEILSEWITQYWDLIPEVEF